MSEINPSLSRRIEMLRFPLIVGILFIHINTNEINFSDSSVFAFVTEYISNVLARVSVPLFFALSGFLFFYTLTPSKDGFLRKLRSRFYTLFIPFVFWNAIIFIFYAFAQTLPVTLHYFSGERPWVMQLDLWQMFELFFGLGDFRYPVAYQFWFIRDLMVVILFSPLIYYFLKKAPLLYLGVVSTVWFFDMLHLPYAQISSSSIFFFSVGGYLGLIGYDFRLSDRYALSILGSYLIVSVADALLYNDYLHNISVLLGTVAAFSVTKYLLDMKKIKNRLLSLAKYSFFVYALHEPLLSVIRKMMFRFVGASGDFVIFILYFLCVFLTIFITIRIYGFIRKISPKVVTISTGGRI